MDKTTNNVLNFRKKEIMLVFLQKYTNSNYFASNYFEINVKKAEK